MDVRAPGLDDVDAMARVHVDGWRETYAGRLPNSAFDADALERRRQMWTSILTSAPRPTRRVAVATSNGHIVGLALADEPRDAADRAAGVAQELYVLYLLRAHHGSGLGQRMLDAVLDNRSATLWVAKDNPRARAFYRRNGFALDGTEKPDDDVPSFIECRMVRR